MEHDAVHDTQRVFRRGVGDSPIPRGSTSMGPQYIATIIVKVQSGGIHVADGGPRSFITCTYQLTLGPAEQCSPYRARVRSPADIPNAL